MKVRVSDYIAEYFASHGIKTVFSVVGGGAMFLNDSIGHHKKIKTIYNHHEQASAIAAEAYYRINNEMAGVCVTSGPGAINALNGVIGAYQDSIPMIVVSGQTKTSLMTVNSGLNLRTLGNQEFDIMSTLSKATKYSQTVMHPEDISYCLEKAFNLAISGRPGPCWLEIPLDIQSSFVDTDSFKHYKHATKDENADSFEVLNKKIEQVVALLKSAKRPVIYAGNGIRIAGASQELVKLAHKTGIPVVTCWDSIDLISTDDDCYVGRAGTMGDRPGNFAVQNSDIVLAIGTRLNIYQVGYQLESWAREAKIIVVDIDPLELKKKTIRVDLPVCADARQFISTLLKKVIEENTSKKSETCLCSYQEWQQKCQFWKKKYPVVTSNHYHKDQSIVNVYALVDKLSRSLPKKSVTVVANGSASVVGSAAYYIGKEQRFIMNCGLSSMGYDLPAAVGAAVALRQQNKETTSLICIAGDGSIMMNLQELQTIVSNKLSVKIVLINNNGYQQIRLTQTNIFNKNFVGLGPDSGDLGFPNFEKLAFAFEIPYKRCTSMPELTSSIEWLNAQNHYCLLEVMCSTDQAFEPKSSSKKLADGSMYSPPLEDLAPFLSREELKENMLIKLWDEK
ncbi:MAG: thiamine pyrophosphate-binding protein [Succinivibrio sp.]|nr:thiamine pyrophosphate-binding protein [Succinivibrio sp.]